MLLALLLFLYVLVVVVFVDVDVDVVNVLDAKRKKLVDKICTSEASGLTFKGKESMMLFKNLIRGLYCNKTVLSFICSY
jgi:hypothetical protein